MKAAGMPRKAGTREGSSKRKVLFFSWIFIEGKNLFLNFCWQFFWSLWLKVQSFACF